MQKKLLALAAALMLANPALPAASEDEGSQAFERLYKSLHPEDREVLEGWEAELRSLIAEARAEASDSDSRAALDAMTALLDAPREAIPDDEGLLGSWRARSLQLSGLGAYAYPYFPAHIYREGEDLVFEKDSGSQRHFGVLARQDEDRYLFVGALYYGYQQQRPYSAHMDNPAGVDRNYDAIGELYRLSEDRLLMLFAPHGQGPLRLYELRR